ncbi:hypothetical protein FPV67DRAFT_437979 [Lyophyllum atratum]|nr:hypothetical protein FPV67DRAFT_437979 [Lyophyllum atratum]
MYFYLHISLLLWVLSFYLYNLGGEPLAHVIHVFDVSTRKSRVRGLGICVRGQTVTVTVHGGGLRTVSTVAIAYSGRMGIIAYRYVTKLPSYWHEKNPRNRRVILHGVVVAQ